MSSKQPTAELSGVSLAYLPGEDRMRCRAEWAGGMRDLHLTRRLTRNLMRCLAGRLERLAAEDVVFEHIEHLRATSSESPSGRSERSAKAKHRGAVATRTIASVEVGQRTRGLVLVLYDDADESYRLVLTLANAHRLVDRLFQKALNADWNLDRDVPWLQRASMALRTDFHARSMH